jgi:hypothetical protein
MPRILLAVCIAAGIAHAEHLVFTTVNPLGPVWISAPEQSKEFGFQSLLFLNDSEKNVQSLHLKVTFSTGKPEEQIEDIVDSGHVYVSLDPGEQKRLDVFLARIEALSQKLRSTRREVAWVRITIESAEFADGSRWDPGAPALDIPTMPAK